MTRWLPKACGTLPVGKRIPVGVVRNAFFEGWDELSIGIDFVQYSMHTNTYYRTLSMGSPVSDLRTRRTQSMLFRTDAVKGTTLFPQ